MNILIVGAGGMGCRFALSFLEGGASVTLCDIWQEHIDAINQNGLRVITNQGERYVKIPAVTDIRKTAAVDAVVIFTKSGNTEEAVKNAIPAVSAGAPFISFQNGLGNIDVLIENISADRVIAGVTDYPAALFGPGTVRIEGKGYTRLAALSDKQKEMAARLCEMLSASGMDAKLSENIMKEVWEKVAFNCAHNPITALTRQRVGAMGKSPFGEELCFLVAKEVCETGRADGIEADYDAVLRKFSRTVDPSESGEHITSMLQDVLNGRPTEADAILGAVIRKAMRHGIQTPCLHTLYNLIKIIENNYANEVKKGGRT